MENNQRYILHDAGIVEDTKTNLEWIAGPDTDINWYQTNSWVKSIGVDWRMPTIFELAEIYEKDLGNRNMTPLLKTTGWWVWASETVNPSSAWCLYCYYGSSNCYNCSNEYNSRGFAVRNIKNQPSLY